MCVCVHTHEHGRIYIHTHAHMYGCTHTHVCIHVCAYIQLIVSQEYKTQHDRVGKATHRELGKKFEFDHTNKSYIHNPESVPENEMHKVLWDFQILTDHLISARRPNLVTVNKKKKTCRIMDFAVLADHRVKLKESEKRDKYQDFARELKNYGKWKWW